MRRQAVTRRSLLHLDAVLVGAGQEIDIVAVEPHEARNRIGRQRLVGMADMRCPVGVRYRGGDIELGRFQNFLASRLLRCDVTRCAGSRGTREHLFQHRFSI